MDLPSYSNMNTLIVLILLTIFKLQIYCRSRIFFILFCVCVTLHLKFLLSGLNDEIDLTDQLMSLFFILWISYFQRSNNLICYKTWKASGIDNSICHKTIKVPWIDNSETSRLADLLPNNNILNKTGIICEQGCTVVCAVWDSGNMGCPCNRCTTFHNRPLNINCRAPVLANNGFFFNEDSSAVQCCRCQRTLSHLDDTSNLHSLHEEYCYFKNVPSGNYKDFFQDQESVIHQQISEGRRHYREETARNAAGSGQIGALPQAASQSTDDGCLGLPSRDSTGTSPPLLRISEDRRHYREETARNAAGSGQIGSLPQAASQSTDDGCLGLPSRDSTGTSPPLLRISEGRRHYREETARNAAGSGQIGALPQAASQSTDDGCLGLPSRDSTGTSPPLLRTQTTSTLERSSGSAHSATFDEHLGVYSRTSNIACGDCSISEPANMVYTEITPTIRVTEGEQHWQSHAEMGHNTAVSVEPWASTQTVGTIVMNLPASHEEIAAGNIATTRTTPASRIIAAMRRNNRRRHHSSRQQRCCRVS